MKDNKKLFYLAPNYNDACSYYRGIGPFSRLKNVQTTIPKDSVAWSTVIGNDIAFLQRPCNEQHSGVVSLLAKQKIPIWIDYDDDLINVPLENPAHGFFTPLRPHIEKIINTANILTTTTKELADLYKSINPKLTTIVIPNAWDDYLWGTEQKEYNPTKTIFWRGSDSHVKDLMEVSQSLVEISRMFPEYQFVFMGMNPWFLQGKMQYGHIKPIDIIDYFGFLAQPDWQPEITIVPLEDNIFNKGKSNIAWIEATSCNSSVLAPDFIPSFNRAQKLYTKDPWTPSTELFRDLLWELIDTPVKTKKINTRQSWEYIKENLLLSKVNLLRQEIINNI